MTNVDLRFSGHADFKQVMGQYKALEAQIKKVNAEMHAAAYTGGPGTNAKNFAKQNAGAAVAQRAFSDAAASTGQFDVVQQKVTSHTDELTKSLQKQRVGLRQAIKDRKALTQVYQEQLRLQRASMTSFGTDSRGNLMSTLTIPPRALNDMGTLRQRLGMISSVLDSVSTKTINWGKNTQWAGRQLTVGFSVPLAALGALSGKAAFDVDQNLTRVAKVYDTSNNLIGNSQQKAAQRQNELNQLRSDGLATAEGLAKNYGAAQKDTLDVQAQLAAVGKRGVDLQKDTVAVQRLAILGEFDYQKAVDASVATQQIFHKTSEQTVDSFNYMNAVENATSLSMEDFAEAIPIAGAAVNQLGGSIKDLGLLMVAFKARGIPAKEGANALKAAMGKLYNPSKQVQADFEAITGKTIPDIVKAAKGELIPTFQGIGDAIRDLDKVQRTKALSGLFGIHQSTRLTAAVLGLTEDLDDPMSQVYRTRQVNRQSDVKNAATANQELEQQAESAAGKIKRAWQGIIVELAKMGQSFLGVGAKMLNMASGALKLFQTLPGIAKFLLKIGLVGVGLAGPLLVLVGLFGNLAGQGLRIVKTMLQLGSTWKLQTKEQTLSAKAADLTNLAMKRQAKSVATVSEQIQILTNSLAEGSAAQRNFANSSKMVRGGGAGSNVISTGDPVVRRPIEGYSKESVAKAAKKAETTKKYMGAAATSAAAISASAFLMVQPWSETLNTVGKYVLLLGLAQPLIASTLIGLKRVPALATAGIAKLKTGLGGVRNLAKSALTSFNFWAVGIAAAAVVMVYLYKKSKEAGKAVQKIYDDTKGLEEIFNYKATGEIAPVKGEPVKQISEQTKKITEFGEKYAEVVDKINKLSNDPRAQFNVALSQGLKIINTGGTVDDAKQAVRLALRAANIEASEADKMILKFGIDFEDIKKVIRANFDQAGELMEESFAKANDRNFFGKIMNADEATDESKKLGASAGKQFGQSWKQAVERGSAGTQVAYVKGLVNKLNKEFADINKDPANKSEYLTAEESRRIELLRTTMKQILVSTGTAEGLAEKWTKDLAQSGNYADVLLHSSNKLTAEMRTQLGIMTTGLPFMLNLPGTFASLFSSFGSSAESSMDGVSSATDNARLAAQRLSAELSTAQDQAKKAYDETWGKGGAIANRTATSDAFAFVGESMKSALDANFEHRLDGMQAAAEAASNALQARQEKAADALKERQEKAADAFKARQDKESDAFENRQKRESDLLEKRQKKIRDAFEAEWKDKKDALQEESDMRQKMFEDALNNVERLAQAQTAQANFTIALRSGNLDEAAKIGIEQDSSVVKDRLTDQQQREQDAYDKKMDLLDEEEQREQDRLDAREKREQDALDVREKREQDALDKRLKAEENAFKKSQEIQEKNLQRQQNAEKSSLDQRNQNNQEAARRTVEIHKRALEMELEGDLAYTPKTKEEAQKRVNYLLTKYDKMGINLRDMGITYSQQLNDTYKSSLNKLNNQLKSNVDWAGIAKKSAKISIEKVWGMSIGQFMNFINNPAGLRKAPISHVASRGGAGGTTRNHSGGWISDNKGSRKGYAESNSPMPSEKMVLAQRGEFMIQKKAAQKMPPEFLGQLNDPHRKWRTGGGSMSGFLEASQMSEIINRPQRKIIKNIGQRALDSIVPDDVYGGGNLSVPKYGWSRPWRGHHTTSNGHDWNLSRGTPIYAPHSGYASGYDIRGYEPRVSHGGHGYRSYGRVIKFDSGGADILFAHNNDRRYGKNKTKVQAGTLLGHSGETGNAHGPHSHIEVNRNPGGGFGPFMRSHGVSLRRGGTLRYDNTLVNAHKGETVLNKRLTDRFSENIENSAGTSHSVSIGDINVQVGGDATPATGRKIALEIKKELDYEVSRYGVGRKR